ncbi:hypothetical protein RA210_U390003 [Rubrivivax sp. A210]|nr:hypothetical protein RA210_U390003 [Rubrivivax sp. A210]
MVRGTFSPARAWWPAAVARLARTLGVKRPQSASSPLCTYQPATHVLLALRRASRVTSLAFRRRPYGRFCTGNHHLSHIQRYISRSRNRCVLSSLASNEQGVRDRSILRIRL